MQLFLEPDLYAYLKKDWPLKEKIMAAFQILRKWKLQAHHFENLLQIT